jgi:hypothetical protein
MIVPLPARVDLAMRAGACATMARLLWEIPDRVSRSDVRSEIGGAIFVAIVIIFGVEPFIEWLKSAVAQKQHLQAQGRWPDLLLLVAAGAILVFIDSVLHAIFHHDPLGTLKLCAEYAVIPILSSFVWLTERLVLKVALATLSISSVIILGTALTWEGLQTLSACITCGVLSLIGLDRKKTIIDTKSARYYSLTTLVVAMSAVVIESLLLLSYTAGWTKTYPYPLDLILDDLTFYLGWAVGTWFPWFSNPPQENKLAVATYNTNL